MGFLDVIKVRINLGFKADTEQPRTSALRSEEAGESSRRE